MAQGLHDGGDRSSLSLKRACFLGSCEASLPHFLAAWRQQIEQKCLTSSHRLSCCGIGVDTSRVESSLGEFSTSRSSSLFSSFITQRHSRFSACQLKPSRSASPPNPLTYNPSFVLTPYFLLPSVCCQLFSVLLPGSSRL